MIRFTIAYCALIAFTVAEVSAADRSGVSQKKLDESLDRIIAEHHLAGASIAVAAGDRVIYRGASGCAVFSDKKANSCKRKLKSETKVRVASVSKMAVAMVAQDMAAEGLLDLDTDVSEYLGFSFRNPHYPDQPITMRHLLAHVSSVRDPEEYWVAAPEDFSDLLQNPSIFADAEHEPGAYFTYANLNYGIAAGIMEKVSGKRFDRLMSARLFVPMELDAGFNWSGVSTKARRKGATLYRPNEEGWRAQTDSEDTLLSSEPYFLKTKSIKAADYLAAYEPGHNPTLFSPQGGLRANTLDLIEILGRLRSQSSLVKPVWKFDDAGSNGDSEDGLYEAFGTGVHTVYGNASFAPDLTMVGHAGDAYGLMSGAWLIRADQNKSVEDDVRISFVITGTPPPKPGAHPSFRLAEEKLMRLGFRVAGLDKSDDHVDDHHGHHNDDDPRPYDETRDANADVDAALDAAAISDKNVLLVLGANWCHDSRGLARNFQREELAQVVSDHYELVYVDVGRRDRNLDVGARFDVPELYGTPTVLILSPDGTLLNRETVHEWRTADSKPYDETLAYFERFAARKP